MSDEQKTGYDPANTSPAEGQSHAIPDAARGKNPDIDPARKEPAEGGRDEVEADSTPAGQ